MLIRPAKPEDARVLAGYIMMAEPEMIEFFSGTDDREGQIDFVVGNILSPVPNRYSLSCALVAESDGKPAGMVQLFPADSQPELDKPILEILRRRGLDLQELSFEGVPGTYYVSSVTVAPEARGLGIGSRLLEAGAEGGREKGFDAISLLVADGNPRAKALYERIGYAAHGEVDIAGTKYIRMRKPI